MTVAFSPIQQIDARRIEFGISIERLSVAAGISERQYRRFQRLQYQPSPETISALSAALGNLSGKPSNLAVPYHRLTMYCYFAVLGIVCQDAGIDTADVHSQDPARKATADPAWRRAAKLRWDAIYLVNCALGVPQVDIAKAIGLTPAAVSLACRAGEDALDDPDFEARMARLTRVISGGEFR